MKRMAVYYQFTQAKAMALICTDVAARGLDFPTVEWVLQGDCPEDVATYIHRVGRTARYLSGGQALLLLTPRECEGMLPSLEDKKIPLKKIKMNPERTQSVGPALQALLSKNSELKECAQRALVAYLRSIFLQRDKAIFDVSQVPVSDLAVSWGLSVAPKLRFLRKMGKAAPAGISPEEPRVTDRDQQQMGGRSGGAQGSPVPPGSPPQERKTTGQKRGREGREDDDGPQDEDDLLHGGDPLSTGTLHDFRDASDDEELLVIKKQNVFDIPGEAGRQELAPGLGDGAEEVKRKKKKKLKIVVGASTGQRQLFDDSGHVQDPLAVLASDAWDEEDMSAAGEGERITAHKVDGSGVYVVADHPEKRFRDAAQILRMRDKQDKQRLKELKKEVKAKKKAKDVGEEEEERPWKERDNAGDEEDGADRDVHVPKDGEGDDEDLGSFNSHDYDVEAQHMSGRGMECESSGLKGSSEVKRQQGAPGGTTGLEASAGRGGPSITEQEALVLSLLRRRA